MLYHWLGSEAEEHRSLYGRSFICDGGNGVYGYDFDGEYGAIALGRERNGVVYIDEIALVTALG